MRVPKAAVRGGKFFGIRDPILEISSPNFLCDSPSMLCNFGARVRYKRTRFEISKAILRFFQSEITHLRPLKGVSNR